MSKKKKYRAEWELYHDPGFYGMFAVREKGDTNFNSPRLFHFINKSDAEEFKRLIEISQHAVRG
jgi:hypothetical protein